MAHADNSIDKNEYLETSEILEKFLVNAYKKFGFYKK